MVVGMKEALQGESKREFGLASAIVLVVANMIGTGVFTTSGFILEELGSPKALLLCWLLGGVFALAGALCYGELGAMLPKSGGGNTLTCVNPSGRCRPFYPDGSLWSLGFRPRLRLPASPLPPICWVGNGRPGWP